MINCAHDVSQRFLAGELGDSDRSEFILHLDTCVQCQRSLEDSAGDASDWSMAREVLPFGVSATGAIHRGSSTTDSDFWQKEPLSSSVLGIVSLLAPTDDPAMLGRLGSYEVAGIIGRGGMGIVLKAFDRALNRNVAIKVLDPMLSNEGAARRRFAREARAMAAISHEHIVPVYAVDEHGALPYFVMEYVPGGTLESRLVKNGPLDTVEVVRVGLQIAQALAAAHRQGLVHRDIKPSNILLDQGVERVRVADFGLARAADDATATRSGVLAGTPQYMAPEQVRGETCDAQSDLFSLGCVMYALCSGHSPFRAQTVYAVMQRIVHDQPRPLRENHATVPEWLAGFIGRLLAKRREDRIASADEVARILEQELAYLQNPASVTRPHRSWRTKTKRDAPNRWHRYRLAAIALVAVLGISTAAWKFWPRATDADITRNSADTEIGRMTSSTVPLWNADHIRETRRLAETIEVRWLSSDNDSGPDPWTAGIQQLREKLLELDARSQEPWLE